MHLYTRLQELYQYRELVKNLVVRDLKLRYRSSVLGFLWCLVNPLLMMGVFTLVFTVLLTNNNIEHFPVFILIGILAWNLHSTALVGAINSVVGGAQLIQKVYFPREVLPIATVLSNTVNFPALPHRALCLGAHLPSAAHRYTHLLALGHPGAGDFHGGHSPLSVCAQRLLPGHCVHYGDDDAGLVLPHPHLLSHRGRVSCLQPP